MKTVFEKQIPAPEPRAYRLRLTPALKAMQPGDSVAVKKEVARCLAAYIRRNGGKPITRDNGNNLTRVWWE